MYDPPPKPKVRHSHVGRERFLSRWQIIKGLSCRRATLLQSSTSVLWGGFTADKSTLVKMAVRLQLSEWTRDGCVIQGETFQRPHANLQKFWQHLVSCPSSSPSSPTTLTELPSGKARRLRLSHPRRRSERPRLGPPSLLPGPGSAGGPEQMKPMGFFGSNRRLPERLKGLR